MTKHTSAVAIVRGSASAAPPPGGKSERLQLRIGGLKCEHCPPTIEKAVSEVAGVSQVHVNPATQVATIDFDPERAKIGEVLQAIRMVGYTPGTATMRVPIRNMHCSSCITRVELALQLTPGVVSARASLGPNAADIEYQPEKVDFEAIRKAIESAGYRVAQPKLDPRSETLDPGEAANEEEYRVLMRKFWLAATISLPVMALSYPDLIPGLREWMPMGSETRRVVWALLGVLSLPVLLWAGSQFFTGMWDALKHRSANMHTLIAIGISAAFAYSVVSVAWPGIFPDTKLAEVFWDVTDVVVALVVLGLALEIRRRAVPRRRSRS